MLPFVTHPFLQVYRGGPGVHSKVGHNTLLFDNLDIPSTPYLVSLLYECTTVQV